MQTHVRPLLAFTAFLALTACTSTPHEDADPDATPVAVPAFAAVPPPPDLAPEIDTCGATTYGWIVGKNSKEIPPTPDGKVIRVICTTCMMTMDFNASRLNIFFDQKTGTVARLSCG